jgi:proteasome lid subunit RPN8/RPN11
MAIELTREELKQIEDHGSNEYPNECCGILLGKEQDGRKVVSGILPLKNSRPASETSSLGQPELIDLLKQAYRLMQQLPHKDDAMRDWLQRADPLINSSRNRFLILSEDLVSSDREARRRGVDILGFYHSHPDHPARPSEFDREHAWPWYTYLIVAVEKGTPRDTTGWLLTEDRAKFLPEEVSVK